MTADVLGPFSRRLLKLRDDKLRRCWWCGEWAYDLEDCTTCTAPVTVDSATTAAAWAGA